MPNGLTNSEAVPVGKKLKFFSTSPSYSHLLTKNMSKLHVWL